VVAGFIAGILGAIPKIGFAVVIWRKKVDPSRQFATKFATVALVCATVRLISLFLAAINHLLTDTYKT